MDEPRDQPPDAAPRAPIVAAASELPSPKRAWSQFVRHVTRTCTRCRDINQTTCPEAERLYQAWQQQSEAALRRLGAETS